MPPDIRHIAGEFFIFQQDSAPAHSARETILNAKLMVSSRRIYGRRTASTSIQSTTKSESDLMHKTILPDESAERGRFEAAFD